MSTPVATPQAEQSKPGVLPVLTANKALGQVAEQPAATVLRRYGCTWRIENSVRKLGYAAIAGCDEAGRGALLGPLYAAAVILDPARRIPGLDDSKKLTPDAREEFAIAIRAKALAFAVR